MNVHQTRNAFHGVNHYIALNDISIRIRGIIKYLGKTTRDVKPIDMFMSKDILEPT